MKSIIGGMPVIWTAQKFKTPSSYIVYGHKIELPFVDGVGQ